MLFRVSLLIFLIVLTLDPSQSLGQTLNGFDLEGATIPVNEIKRGGPPRDGIPSIDNPKFIDAQNSKLNRTSRILGVVVDGIAKAYPISIMNYHEIVNDSFGNTRVVVTYCPLCGSGVAYHSRLGGINRTFGVSGLLYNSDVLLYDRESESLWSQMMSEAVSGPLKGEKLVAMPTANTTWIEWMNRYPNSLVLSEETGHNRDYSRTPYAGYDESQQIYFPVNNRNYDYHQKELIIGMEIQGKFKAYPFSELMKTKSPIDDNFNGTDLVIHFDKENNTARLSDSDGNDLPYLIAFWFAWYTFHPDTEVFKSDK